MIRSPRSILPAPVLAATLTVAAALTTAPPARAAAASPPPSPAAPGLRVTFIGSGKVRAGELAGAHRGVRFLPAPAGAGGAFHLSAVEPRPAASRAPAYQVRVRLLGRSGAPLPPPSGNPDAPYSFLGTVVNTATGASPAQVGYDKKAGAYTMRLPRGDYYLDGLVSTPAYRAAMIQPEVSVLGPTTITLDARTAVPVITRVSHPGARTLLDYVEIDQTIARARAGSAYGTVNAPGHIVPFYVTPTATVTGRPFTYSLHATLTDPASFPLARQLKPASYEYQLIFVHQGSVPASLDYHVAAGQLAAVRTRYYGQRATLPKADSAQQASLPLGPGDELAMSFDSPVVIAAAGRATIYYNAAPHVRWFRDYFINDVSADPVDVAPLEAYRPGHAYARGFGAAALAPAGEATRRGNILTILPAPFSPAEPGHYMPAASLLGFDGSSVVARLSLNGQVIGVTGSSGARFLVPGATGRYTLTEVATRPAGTWSVLGTRSTAVWSFFSGRTPGAAALPLLTVRVSGPFSLSGSVAAGRPVRLNLTIDELPYGAHLTSLTLAASVDGGKTWRPVHVYRAGRSWLALLTTPAGNGYVSLRTSATDSAGDSAVVSTIRAFAVTAGAAANG
jgi:hypothetical protein